MKNILDKVEKLGDITDWLIDNFDFKKVGTTTPTFNTLMTDRVYLESVDLCEDWELHYCLKITIGEDDGSLYISNVIYAETGVIREGYSVDCFIDKERFEQFLLEYINDIF